MKRRRLVAATCTVLVMAGCGDSPPPRADVVADLADSSIVPVYEQLAENADDLAAATSLLCEQGDERNLAATRRAMEEARATWKRAEATWLGPVMERRSWAVIDWPISTADIDDLINDPTQEISIDTLGTAVGADQRGLGAVEYILGSDDGVALQSLEDARRCDYLAGISEVIADEAEVVLSDWTDSLDGGEAYRDLLAQEADGSVDALVGDSLFLIEGMTDAELGSALGVMGGQPDTEALIEGPAGLGVADLLNRLAGLRAVLVGEDAQSGLSDLLGDDLTERLSDELDAATEAAASIDAPLRTAAATDPQQIENARNALLKLRVTVSTEVVSELGVTVGFSDADGDSAG